MFTKDNLKTGMVVEYRNGGKYIVVLPNNDLEKGIFTGYCEYMPIKKYTDNLMLNIKEEFPDTYVQNQSDFDIMKIWRCSSYSNIMSMTEKREDSWTDRFGELIFDRNANIDITDDEPEEMTMEQICKALGKNVKIVKEN